MAIEVRLPQAGMGMTDGTVLGWLRDVGDEVRQGECIAEVEAAKTTVEIEAPCDGILARILAPAGTLVPVREIMALIVSPAEPAQPSAEPVPSAAAEVQVVPAARRLAREHGIALTDVPGSGPGGRITEADVRARIEPGPAAPVLPLAGTRGVIARRMLASLQGSAQYTLVRTVDVTALADQHDHGALPVGATYTDAVARAVVLSLAAHPNLNAHITGEQVRLAAAIDLGIGIDTEGGLVVGVLRNAGDLGLAELSARRKALTERVRAGRAGVAELQGSTFTISNLGALGIDAFTPIINPPEVAILGVGRILDEPAPAAGGITWRKVMTLSLTVDHRAVDGAPAARFLAGVADRLQAPAGLLLQKHKTQGGTTVAGRVAGKVAFITGAARGQGRSHAIRLAQEGADIIAVDLCGQVDSVPFPMATPEDLAETVKEVEALDRRIIATQADVRDYPALKAALDEGVAQLGRLDIVSANAGICSYGRLDELAEQSWQDVIDTNLTGVWHAAKAAIPHLKAGGHGGSIVLTSSDAGLFAMENIGHYVAAKHGVIGLMRTLALELAADFIRVNAICPTTVNTPMIHNEPSYRLFRPDLDHPTADDLGDALLGLNALPIRWVEPVDISNALLFLASDEARYVTGVPLPVDAGALVK